MANFTIFATAQGSGAISPSEAVSVASGANQTFTFTPNTGFSVNTVLVDGVSQTVASSYTFTNVTANHTITVAFLPTTAYGGVHVPDLNPAIPLGSDSPAVIPSAFQEIKKTLTTDWPTLLKLDQTASFMDAKNNLVSNVANPLSSQDAVTLSYLNSYPTPVGFRNRLINGDMRIDQRHAGASQTVSSSDSGDTLYRVDRWQVLVSTGTITAQQIGNVGGFKDVLQLTGSSSNPAVGILQRIESLNTFDLASTTVTLSAYVASSSVTAISWAAYYPTATDNWSGASLFQSGTWYLTPTLTRQTAQISLPSQAVNGLQIYFALASLNTGVTFTITGVQLELGSNASPFEVRPYDYELQRCQRYCRAWRELASSNNQVIGNAQAISSSSFAVSLPLSVPLRVPPTGVYYSSAGMLSMSGAANSGAVTSITFPGSSGTDGYVFLNTGTSAITGITAGQLVNCLFGYGTSTNVLYLTGCEL
jgi:hypothetical protein